MHEKIEVIIKETIKDFIDQEEMQLLVALDGETPLYGEHGLLDSVGLVSLVVAVEQAIEDELGVSLSLADEKAMSQTSSPYRTIGSLAAYAHQLLVEEM